MTSEQRYKLVFSGQLLEGFEADAVRKSLATALKLGDAQLKKLFSGRLITVRKGLDSAQAEKFRTVFERAGARVHVHVDGGDDSVAESAPATATAPRAQGKLQAVGKLTTALAKAGASAKDSAKAAPATDVAKVAAKPAANSKDKARPVAAAPTGEGEIECPRCAHRQPASEQCVHCRMDLRRYLRRLERRAKLRERRRQAGVG